ncbi:MAG TPA: TRAP transporter large permease [Steroidobacteraceae bacterium]|nr:TRAP transporter large permease [Steroidobacteraceae bacterium]
MSPELIGVIGVISLFTLLALGMPISFSMGVVGTLGLAVILGWDAALTKLAVSSFNSISSVELAALPLFLLMAQVLFAANVSRDLYVLAARFVGHWPGGLAMATIGGCAGFGSISSSSLATAATMGLVALPEMKARNYSNALATGSVAAGGTMGSMIPPSGMLIMYGVLTEQSIGKLFMAGVIPGLLQAVMYIILIWILCKWRPSMGPPGPRYSWAERWQAVRGITDLIILTTLVMGGLIVGWFTATESGAVGALGAIALTFSRKRLTMTGLLEALQQTMRTTGMIYGVIIGAFLFSYFMAVSEIPAALAGYITDLQAPPIVIIMCILAMLLAMGIFLDAMAMMTLTLPVFYPIVMSLGLSPIWFGILMVRAQETALITPPMGMNIYVVSALRKDIPLSEVFRGVLPFLAMDIPHIALLILFPALALWLPSIL